MRLNDEQLRELQRRNGPALLSYLARRIEPPQDAAALFNEVLEVVWRRSADAPTDPEEARMWMFGIAARLAANHRRSSTRRHALTERLADELAAHPAPVATDEILAVRAAIGRLPQRERELVRLVH